MGKHYIRCLACGMERNPDSAVKFYKFPQNSERRAVWLTAINKAHLINRKLSVDQRVCESHFPNNMLGEKKKRLKKAAVPKTIVNEINNSKTSKNLKNVLLVPSERVKDDENKETVIQDDFEEISKEIIHPVLANKEIIHPILPNSLQSSRVNNNFESSFKEFIENTVVYDEVQKTDKTESEITFPKPKIQEVHENENHPLEMIKNPGTFHQVSNKINEVSNTKDVEKVISSEIIYSIRPNSIQPNIKDNNLGLKLIKLPENNALNDVITVKLSNQNLNNTQNMNNIYENISAKSKMQLRNITPIKIVNQKHPLNIIEIVNPNVNSINKVSTISENIPMGTINNISFIHPITHNSMSQTRRIDKNLELKFYKLPEDSFWKEIRLIKVNKRDSTNTRSSENYRIFEKRFNYNFTKSKVKGKGNTTPNKLVASTNLLKKDAFLKPFVLSPEKIVEDTKTVDEYLSKNCEMVKNNKITTNTDKSMLQTNIVDKNLKSKYYKLPEDNSWREIRLIKVNKYDSTKTKISKNYQIIEKRFNYKLAKSEEQLKTYTIPINVANEKNTSKNLNILQNILLDVPQIVNRAISEDVNNQLLKANSKSTFIFPITGNSLPANIMDTNSELKSYKLPEINSSNDITVTQLNLQEVGEKSNLLTKCKMQLKEIMETVAPSQKPDILKNLLSVPSASVEDCEIPQRYKKTVRNGQEKVPINVNDSEIPYSLPYKIREASKKIQNLRIKLQTLTDKNKELQKENKNLEKENKTLLEKRYSNDGFVEEAKKILPPVLASIVECHVNSLHYGLTGRRYPDDFKNFCLTLYRKAPSAYKFLAKNMNIPSTTTLLRLKRKEKNDKKK